MEKKVDEHIFQGMQRDSSISKQQAQFLWDAENIRLTAKEGDTLLSVTNEKGVEESLDTVGEPVKLAGIYVGHCVLGNYLTVFTYSPTKDYIYRVEKTSSGYRVKLLYGSNENQGSLGFSPDHPLQTLGVFENEKIQKVYWTDGINQPRIINICKSLLSPTAEANYISTSFDFVPEMQLKDSIKVHKISDSTGMFPAGVIQYAVSYYNKYGQQSNISCVSSLIPTSFLSRAGSPEEKIGNSFRITVNGVDNTFEYLRLYSIFRSSLDGTPICKRVADVKIGDGGNNGGSYYQLIVNNTPQTDNCYYLSAAEQASNPFYIRTTPGSSGNFVALSSANLPEVSGKVTSMVDTGNYYCVNKEDYPYAVLRLGDSNSHQYVIWGDATKMYISKNSTTGMKGQGFYVVMTDDTEHTTKVRIVTSNDAPYYEEKQAVDSITVTDNWTIGETIDAQELMYIGGDSITADTIEAKDGTLFLGNIHYTQVQLEDYKEQIRAAFFYNNTDRITLYKKTFLVPLAINGDIYKWGSTLNAVDGNGYAINPTHFKRGEHYRFGVQFQHKSGKWSEPIFITDKTVEYGETEDNTFTANISALPSGNSLEYSVPCFSAEVPSGLAEMLYDIGYRRVRGVVVYPTTQDRIVLAQGVMNPTVQSVGLSSTHTPDYQSSWFFRPRYAGVGNINLNDNNVINGACIQNFHNYTLLAGKNRGSEIQGVSSTYSNVNLANYNSNSGSNDSTIFGVTSNVCTLHSPEFEFDDSLYSLELNSYRAFLYGYAEFIGNVGDIDIQTSSGPIGKSSSGFNKHTLYSSRDNNNDGPRKLCAGLFYRDWLVDEDRNNEKYRQYPDEGSEVGFMIYPWQKSGSLNNDCNRPDGVGTRSAVLKKKIISNLSFTTNKLTTLSGVIRPNQALLFRSDQMELCKLGQQTYYGNVDTLLSPKESFSSIIAAAINNDVVSGRSFTTSSSYIHDISEPTFLNGDIGDKNPSLISQTENIRMKYKSTPHAVLKFISTDFYNPPSASIYVVELQRYPLPSVDFGGDSEEARQSNVWLPAGEAVVLKNDSNNYGATFYYTYGDTYYQRYDCLKTYAFTPEDENQIVEIGSFMLETHINIDGRYDKNRGQDSNLYMSPQNFNLINPVYSQKDNFFSYKILDSDFYKLNDFPATINWTLLKNNASEVDIWTTINMGSSLDVDGTLGPVTSIKASDDILYCFQERGVSQIMFNSRVQIPTSDNVPIEISNNYKVEGNRYISTSIGCYNKFAITSSPNGIYFVDGISKSLYLLQGQQLANISSTHGFDYWFSKQDSQSRWIPARTDRNTQEAFTGNYRVYGQQGILLTYDKANRDLYVITPGKALCYSEKLQQFISFMSYANVSGMLNMGSTFHSLYTWHDQNPSQLPYGQYVQLYDMFEGPYNSFFTKVEPSSITFVSNADMLLDKVFTNLESRVDFYDQDGKLQHNTFFDTLRVWNEYQDTDYDTYINTGGGLKEEHTTILNHKTYPYNSPGVGSNVKKKFRIWRVDIPRSSRRKNVIIGGILQSVRVKSNDRIRNTWCKVKLTMNNKTTASETLGMEMHDIGVIYYV